MCTSSATVEHFFLHRWKELKEGNQTKPIIKSVSSKLTDFLVMQSINCQL